MALLRDAAIIHHGEDGRETVHLLNAPLRGWRPSRRQRVYQFESENGTLTSRAVGGVRWDAEVTVRFDALPTSLIEILALGVTGTLVYLPSLSAGGPGYEMQVLYDGERLGLDPDAGRWAFGEYEITFRIRRPAGETLEGLIESGPWLALYTSGAPGLTTTRSSPATYHDRSGILRTAAPGVLRLDWRDGRPYALVEGGATNGIRNPRAEGAVVGPVGAGGSLPTHWGVDTDGGLTWEVVGTGVEDGLPYVEFRVHGTPTSTVSQIRCEAYGQIAAAAGQTWTGSAYARIAGGSLDGIGSARIALQERTGSTFRGQTMTPITLSATRLSAGRVAATRTLSHAETTDVLLTVGLSSLTVGVPVDITLRVAGPQLEPGSVATALTLPPPGTLAASTRDRDLVSVGYAHAPGSLAVLTAGREAGLGQVGQAHEWQIGASTDLDARALRIRRDGSEETLRLWLGSGSARVQSAVPVVPHGAEYQRLALLDVQGTEARVRLMQRHREGGAWVDADGGWSSWLDVSELLALGWEAPFLTIGNVREGTRAGRLALSLLGVLRSADWSLDSATRLPQVHQVLGRGR